MERKIRRYIFSIGFFVSVFAIFLTLLIYTNAYTEQVRTDLKRATSLIAAGYDPQAAPEALSDFAKSLRVTLIAPDGAVLYESARSAAEMDNHQRRPEVASAMQTGQGQAARKSDTLGQTLYYYAVRLSDGNVLRTSMDAPNALSTLADLFPAFLAGLLVVLILSIVLARCLTKKLLRPIEAAVADMEHIEQAEAYAELEPLIQEIAASRARIQTQVKTIAQEQNRLLAVIENMSEGLLILDMEKKIVMLNQSAKQHLGFNGDCIGKDVHYLTRNLQINRCIDQALGGQTISEHTKTAERRMEAFASPVFLDGAQTGVIVFLFDLTDTVRLERMKQEFTANVSHELKTPLTSISGYAEMIETGMAKQEDIVAFASKIHKEAGRLLALISDIIRLSELDEKHDDLMTQQVDLLDVANECAEILQMPAKERKVQIRVSGAHHAVVGNRRMISELVYNLCDNAIRYNKENGRVDVEIGEKSITVRDTGIGISERHQQRIFERFYRVDKSRSKETGGTGLGLAIVKHVAEQHRADIVLQSAEGNGTAITIRFPC